MPGPFPGMDPYLERRSLWQDLHTSLIIYLRAELNRLLPPGFRASVEERVQISVIIRALREAVRRRHIEIVALGSPDSIVTVIEILSPSNKEPGADRDDYLVKQAALLESQTHMLEVDLLRGGWHTIACPQDEDGLIARSDYRICLHRAGARDTFEVWPVALQEPLPEVRVPLTEDYADLRVELQPILDRAYDEGVGRNVIYDTAPAPPLRPEDRAWAEALLTAK